MGLLGVVLAVIGVFILLAIVSIFLSLLKFVFPVLLIMAFVWLASRFISSGTT